MREATLAMRCFKVMHDHISGPGIELKATSDDAAIVEARQIMADRWAFEVWDGPRVVYSSLQMTPTTVD